MPSTHFNVYRQLCDSQNVGGKVVCTLQGKLLQVHVSNPQTTPPLPQSRSVIRGFTPSSRLRLLKFIAKVDWSTQKFGLLITLTYPDKVAMRTRKERNRDKYLFLRYMEKFLGKKVYGVWRVEWKERKTGSIRGVVVPHFHFLLVGVRYISHKEINLWWRKILKVKGPLCTDVKQAKNGELAGVYIAKYLSKPSESHCLDNPSYLNSNGRHYGYVRKKLIPMCPVIQFPNLTEEEIAFLIRQGKDILPHLRGLAPQSFSLLGDKAIETAEILCMKGIDRIGRKK